MQIHITVDDAGVRAELGRLAGRLGNLTPAMRGIGEIVRTSVERNFAAAGRPQKWKESRRVKEKGGQTLSDTGRLRRSFTVKAYAESQSLLHQVNDSHGYEKVVLLRSHGFRVAIPSTSGQ